MTVPESFEDLPGEPTWPHDVIFVNVTDDRFAGPASLALISAALSTGTRSRCVILADEISAVTSSRIAAAFARAGVAVDVIDLAGSLFDSLPFQQPWGRTPFVKFFLGRLFGGMASRLLWLDADTLTVGPIDELLSMNLEGCAVGAAQDLIFPFVSSRYDATDWNRIDWSRLGIPPGVGYFNSGVLLIDVQRWLRERIEERALQLLRESPELGVFAEQTALNAALAGRWLPLDARWNARRRPKLALGLRRWVLWRGGLSRSEPVSILHFAGHPKPWNANHPPSPDRRRYIAAWERLVPDFPLDVTARHFSWYAARARRLRGSG